jgi:hypothetical protein
VILALLTVGRHPISDPTRVCVCRVNTDPATFMWALKWWPHALLHGLNPFVSHYVWAPTGANLARSATIPSAAFVMAPATVLFGPVASYNVLSVASPVLAAFTTYLLCRRLVGRELPALAGGYLFGFGPFQFAQLLAHPNISLVFLVPLMVYLAVRRADRELSARVYIGALAVVLALQMGLSTETLATATGLGCVLLFAAYFLAAKPDRRHTGRLILETIAAGLLAAAVTSPFLYYAVIRGGSPHEWPRLSDQFGLDLLNPFFPRRFTWVGGHAFRAFTRTFERHSSTEGDGYLSVPIIGAFVWWSVATRRRLLARLLLTAVAVSSLAALGSHLHVAGIQTVTLPFDWVRHLPVFRLITPSRIAMYIALAVGIGIAAWLAESSSSTRRAARWLVFALGAVMIFPDLGSGLWHQSPNNPAFFRGSKYRHYLTADANVLILPFGSSGYSMLWQAETGFYFRMPEGYLGHFAPPPFEGQPIVGELYNATERINTARLSSFLTAYHVRDIVIDLTGGAQAPLTKALTRLNLRGVFVQGVLLYRVPATVPVHHVQRGL